MACFNYRLYKRASWTPPTQGNFNPGESNHIAQADRIASAWDRPEPVMQQQTNAGGNGGGFGKGMMTGVLSTMGVLAPVAGGLYKKYQQFKPFISAYNNLDDGTKQWIEAYAKNDKGGGGLSKGISQARYAQENPVKAGLGLALKGAWQNIKGLIS